MTMPTGSIPIPIPEADHFEAVYLQCPVAGCEWHMEYSWGEMDNRRPEQYVAHYQEVHFDGP